MKLASALRALLPAVLAFRVAYADAVPVFSPAGPYSDDLGEADHYPPAASALDATPREYVGSGTNADTRSPSHRVPKADLPWSFKRAPSEIDLRYDFDGHPSSIPRYLSRFPVTGLLLIKDDTILFEHYQYARTDRDRLAGNSMTKTIVGMLFGIALEEGKIRSEDDACADYLPGLRGTLYGGSKLHSLLDMSSGIDGEDQLSSTSPQTYEERFYKDVFRKDLSPVAALARLDKRSHPEGTRFRYSGTDNEALTTVLREAVGRPLSEYLWEKIWGPIGAEADAGWEVDASGRECGSYGFNAVLRDYGRFGRLLAHDGAWEGRQLIPRSWVIEATSVRAQDPQVAPGVPSRYYGYGYQVWLFPGKTRMFALVGAGGQYVFVDPVSKLVLVQTAVRYNGPPVTRARLETIALWRALVLRYGGSAP